MSPEQLHGARDLDKRTDIYALGVVLFELIVGRLPFEAPTAYEVMRLHTEAPFPSVRLHRPDLPAAFRSGARPRLRQGSAGTASRPASSSKERSIRPASTPAPASRFRRRCRCKRLSAFQQRA